MSKHFLLSASFLAFLSSQTFASRQTALDLADMESNQQAIIAKLMASNDYTFSLDEEEASERIKNAALVLNPNDRGKKQDPQQLSDLKFETKHRIRSNLDSAKESQARFGKGYSLTKNYEYAPHKGGVLSVKNAKVWIVHPVRQDEREKPNAFLPSNYTSHAFGKPLHDEIRAYTGTLVGLTQKEKDRLYRYLEPLAYIVRQEVLLQIETSKSHRYVLPKNWSELKSSIASQGDHHFFMVRHGKLKGLNQDQVRTALVERLLDKTFSLLPNPHKAIHISGEGIPYYLGKNKNLQVSLIYPSADNLPYPILKNYRSLERANLPYETQITPALQKQWRRIGEFVQVHPRFNEHNRALMKNILDGVGTIFDRHLSRFHVQQAGFPVGNLYQLLTEDMADEFAGNRTIPEPYLTAFYGGGAMNPDFPVVLHQVYSKANSHFYLTGDLWPSYITEDHKRDVLLNSVRYLFFKDILDRSAEFEGLHPVNVRNLALHL